MLAVVVVRGRRKAMKKFPDETQGREFFKVASDRFGKDNTYLVSCSNSIPPPENYLPSRGLLWCPYCGTERKFKWYPSWEESICPICGISTAHFYVKTYNHLWPSADGKEPKKKKEKAEKAPKILKRNILRRKG